MNILLPKFSIDPTQVFTLAVVHTDFVAPLGRQMSGAFAWLRRQYGPQAKLYQVCTGLKEFGDLLADEKNKENYEICDPKIMNAAAIVFAATAYELWAVRVRRVAALQMAAAVRFSICGPAANESIDRQGWHLARQIMAGEEFDKDSRRTLFIFRDYLMKRVGFELLWKLDLALKNRESTEKIATL